MFYESYDFIWTPQRPPRTQGDIEEALKGLTPERLEGFFNFEDRVAVRSLVYCVMDDTNLRNVLDGVLLPPPFSLLDIADRRWTAGDIEAIVRVLNPQLDGLIVQLPFNLALRLGSYDARLRAACRRLCWVLNVPFAVVEAREESVAQLRLALSATDGEPASANADSQVGLDSSLLADEAASADASKQEAIAARKERRKHSLKRAATVGGFAVLGGAALVLTGGLVAPLVAPAFGALVTATTVTLGAIGSFGTAVLGGTALASLFTAVVGIGTHTAALAAVLTPVLSAANITAIFGVSGATLAGYKAIRRTGETDTFMIRSVDEVETFTGSASAPEEEPDTTDPLVADLSESKQAVHADVSTALLGTKLDLTSVVEDGSKPALVIPSHTRTVGMTNVTRMKTINKRNRFIVFGIESALKGFELRMKAIKLTSGVWGMAPPSAIPAGSTGICASMNRYMHPTGTGFILCYVAEPVSTKGASAAFRLWVRVDYDFLGAWEVSSFCEGIDREFDPFKAEMRLEANAASEDYCKTLIGVTMEVHLKPFTYLKVYPSSDKGEHARKVTFPVEELPQRQLEYAHDVKQRRKVAVSFVNNSRHLIYVLEMRLVNGVQWPQTPSPMAVDPQTASLTYFTNASWSLEGAEGYYIVQVINRNDAPMTAAYCARVQFEITALNNLNVAVATAPTVAELRQMEMAAETPASTSFPVTMRPGLFFDLSVRLLRKDGIVELHCENTVERDASARVAEKASMAIGICGYNGVFDARRPMQDQQVGLWQPVLRESTQLLGTCEAYTLQWEDEYLCRFGETVKIDLQVADAVGKKAVSKAKSLAKKQLMQGAIFSGFRAFNTFLGAFDLPLYAVWASDVIDNNYATLSNRAVFAGKDLASALLGTGRGRRPVTLIGFSFGSKVIAECLRELERVEAYGVVENVYVMGATFPADREEWQRIRRIVAGRVVNVYTRSDWALWLMYKANEGELKPMSGITPVSVAGVENVDASAIVQQHSGYALRLAEVLQLIPPCPTEETWSKKSLRGSPGVVVPTTRYKKTVKTMGISLNSVLSSNPFSAFAIRNGFVSDVAGLSTSIELVSVSTFNCFCDFLPPSSVDVGCAGLFGVVGEESGQPIGGVFAFRVRLDPFSERDLLLLVIFYAEVNNDISVTVRPSLITQRATRDESEDDADSRFYVVATQAIVSLDDAKACTVDVAPSPDVLTPKSATATVSFEVPLENMFLDGHRTSSFRVSLSKVPGGVAVHVLALLNRAASQLQQGTFTADVYDRKYAAAAEAAAKAALGIGAADAATSDGGAPAASPAGGISGNLASRPTMAEVMSIDHMQNTLFSIADSCESSRRGVSTTPSTSATAGTPAGGADDDRPPTDSSVSATASLEDAWIVLANCGAVSLFFSEGVRAGGAAERGPALRGGSSVSSRVHHDAGDDEDADPPMSSSSTARCKVVRWVRFPPPELPPSCFCVLHLTNFASGVFPLVRYETADGVCAFDIRATAAVDDTPCASFACAGDGAADTVGCGRLVVCSVVAPLEAVKDGAALPLGDSVGEVSTSTTVVRGARFHLVLMTPKTTGGGKSFASTDADDPTVKKALRSYGWFIA